MKKRIIGMILEIPAVLLLVASFGVGVYAAATKSFGITWGASVILGVILVMYFLGRYLEMKAQ